MATGFHDQPVVLHTESGKYNPELVGNAMLLTLSATNVSCFGQNNGSITSTLTGSSGGAVSYTLNPGSVVNATGIFTGLKADTYTVQANDAGILTSASITVTEPAASTVPSVTFSPISDFCPGAASISLTYSSTTGSPVTYSITAGTPAMPGFVPVSNAAFGANPMIVPIPLTTPVGTYQFTILVSNAAGCSSPMQTININIADNIKPDFNAPAAITVFNDLAGNINILPAFTGTATALSDNCTPASGLILSYSDGVPVAVSGACNLPNTITRTWRVTDSTGNYKENTQLITVKDNIQPNLTIPADISLSCDQGILPAVAGTASATDNCSPVTISYVDLQSIGSCASNRQIERTWTATDCSGNKSSGIQRIIVTDNTKPVATVPNKSVGCPSDIPAPYTDLTAFIADGGTATDNCGSVIFSLYNEISNGLENKPGYCPTSVTRIYRISDACGNYTDAVQTISVLGECGCSKCVAGTNFHLIDLTGKPSGSITVSQQQRNGACCVETNCISFNVQLDVNAIGFELLIDGATPSPQDWRVDCGSVAINGNVICLPGGSFHLFTFCKPGANKNDYTFHSVPGVVGSGNITTRVECNSQLSASGISSNPKWNSISPGVKGQYNSYLSSTTIANPVFTADVNSPPVIQYEICGNIGTTICDAMGIDCTVATIYVKQKIAVAWSTNPSMVCLGSMPTLTANISPVGGYTFEWFSGHGAIGTPIFSGSDSYKPSAAGPYSLKVTDIQSGIACNSEIFNFDVITDNIPPTVLAPPLPLTLQCGDPTASQQITNWLATASASYVKPDGTVVTSIPSNNYSGIAMACNTNLVVTFSAADQCGNVKSVTSTINVVDTQAPTFTTPAQSNSASCQGSDPKINSGYLNWITNKAGAVASDLCDPNLVWSDNHLTQTWATTSCTSTIDVTFTVTDACGNKSSSTATFTISDNQSPVFTFCPSAMTVSTDPDHCYASAVNPGIATATDICSATVITNNAIAQMPAGINVVTWTATDACGNKSTCNQTITVVDNTNPTIACPGNVTQTALPGNCFLANVLISDPVSSDNCAVVTRTWSMSGATIGNSPATGINNVSGQTFNVGITKVIYTVADAAGNSSSCSFDVWIKDLLKPVVTSGCPADITQTVDPDQCSAMVTIPRLTVSDPCNEGFTVTNSFNNTDNASGAYPVGVTVVNWTITDTSGNIATCTHSVTINGLQMPTIACPGNVTQTALPGNCALTNVVIADPVAISICPIVSRTWTMSGSTIGSSPATGINSVSGQTFNVGITTVNYQIVDKAGNTATCTFDVWIKDLVKPLFTSGCPADVKQTADSGMCSAAVTVPKPTVDDPCHEGFSLINSFNNTDNASGTYPIGLTVVNWSLTDASGNVTTCKQNITITDKIPNLSCTSNITMVADFGKLFASNVVVAAPVYSDDCPGLLLTWTMTGVTIGNSPATGINIFTSPAVFNVGVTSIQYTLTDANSHSVNCSFTVTVLSKPDIDCQPDLTRNNDAALCSAAIDPGFPIKLAGADPVTYTWEMTGATIATGSGAIAPLPYLFNTGVTTLTWTATNISGTDACSQVITVLDNEPPKLTVPAAFSFCVEDLISASIVSSLLKINPAPDYFLFKKGSTALDIDPAGFSDNCTPVNQLALHWTINFSASTPAAPVSGSGQPSAYSSDIQFPGNGSTYTDIVHTITYWLVDLKGNESVHHSVPVNIHPRPAVTYLNGQNFHHVQMNYLKKHSYANLKI